MDFIYAVIGFPLGYIMFACYILVQNFGIALILFTFISRAIMFPLSIKQQKSQAKMMYYQPQIKKIQERYKDDRQKMQEETMKFYEKEGLSMTGGGCLPMIIQFAFLFGVIDVVYKPLTHILHLGSAFDSRGFIEPFLAPINKAIEATGGAIINNDYYAQIKLVDYIKSPSFNPDVLNGVAGSEELINKVNGFSLNFLGLNLGTIPNQSGDAWWYWLIPVLSALTALIVGIISMKINQTNQMAGAGGGVMKGMILFMPVVSFIIAIGVPAGVGIYWTVSNIASLGQTIILKKMYNPEKYKDELAEAQAKRKAEEKEKNTLYVEKKVVEDGEEKTVKEELILSKKEKERIAIREARLKMAQKYGDVIVDEEEIIENNDKAITTNSKKQNKNNKKSNEKIITPEGIAEKDNKDDFMK